MESKLVIYKFLKRGSGSVSYKTKWLLETSFEDYWKKSVKLASEVDFFIESEVDFFYWNGGKQFKKLL